MAQYFAPGVHVRHVITESKRVLQTGVPVFLGLVRAEDLAAFNRQQVKAEDEFVPKEIPHGQGCHIARRQGFVRLPPRPPAWTESRLGDSFAGDGTTYLRAVDFGVGGERNQELVKASYGAAGQPGAPAQSAAEISPKPQRFTVWPQFAATYGVLRPFGFLTYAVRGFFENGGRLCYVQLITYAGSTPVEAVNIGLRTIQDYDEYDLVCAPDIMWSTTPSHGPSAVDLHAMQAAIVRHCEQRGDRFAILDCSSGDRDAVLRQRERLSGLNAALYYPWIKVSDGPEGSGGYIPPSGHIAGIYARSDRRTGVHKAPANELVQGVVDLADHVNEHEQVPLNEAGVNCLRAFPKRGIRVWGARTLNPYDQEQWKYVNVRRIFITAGRWIERNLTYAPFEPNTPTLWARIERDLTAYFTRLLEVGALAGDVPETAFYVKCNAETNPPELREMGQVVTEIGLSPTRPAEFIIIRIMHGETGVRISGPV